MRIPTVSSSHLILGLTLAIQSLSPADAAETEPDSTPLAPDTGGQDIVVTAHALRELGLMAGNTELEGDALLRASTPQLGDTLAKLPGVSATSFAPGASRPVLRGQTGDRVQILIDGIGSIDLSSVSADHGVALDTLTTDHIDVLHGPALLAYGGQAIGGAVIAYDKRIPRRMPQGAVDVTAIASFGSAADGKSAAAGIDVPMGSRLAGHVDASWNDSNDLRVGGYLNSAPLRAEILGLADEARASGDVEQAALLEEAANRKGRVSNSFAHGTTFGAGFAFLDDGGNLGVSVQRIDNRYGVPARPVTGEEGVSIDMSQTRYDLRGELDLDGLFDKLQIRGAYADYKHDELEEDGSIGTRFARSGIETRAELVQADRGGWKGRSGLQYSWGRLTVTGDEAILPNNTADRLGAFTIQSYKLGMLELQGAGRIERVSIVAPAAGFDRSFALHSAAGGVALRLASSLTLGASYAHGERAPSPEELLTEGAHVATQAYEIGDPSFGRERSDGVDVYFQFASAGTNLALTGYLTDFRGFITPVATGGTIEGFPVYQYRQLPARFEGFEAQGSQRLAEWGSSRLKLDGSADYVRARIKGVGPLPRIPPLRVQGGLEFESPGLDLRGEVEWNARQDRVSAFETPTGSFALVNLSATWRPVGAAGPVTLILAANNVLDAVGRRSASFTKDFVPLPGRDVRLTAKISL